MEQPWSWSTLALLFVAVEIVSGSSFVAIFFALGAGCAAAACLFGPLAPWQLGTCFVAGSVVPLLLARRPLLAWAKGRELGHPVDSLVGCTVRLHQSLPPEGEGTCTLRGAPWQAKNVTTITLGQADPARVVGIDGLRLLLAAEPQLPPNR